MSDEDGVEGKKVKKTRKKKEMSENVMICAYDATGFKQIPDTPEFTGKAEAFNWIKENSELITPMLEDSGIRIVRVLGFIKKVEPKLKTRLVLG